MLWIAAALISIANAQGQLAELLSDGSAVLRSPAGESLLSVNAEHELIPASLVKIPLAQVALRSLGEDFRFQTHFYHNDSGDLLIRGLGDPFLVSEEVALISQALAALGLTQVRRLVVDDSAFAPDLDLPLEPGADDPYAARNSALAVNFNTVNLAWLADGMLVSGEPQTPLTPLARQLGARLGAGDPQRINLGADPVNGLKQVQQVFAHFLQESDIAVADQDFYHQQLSDQWTLLYAHASSRSLRDTLEGLLRYSNNFIANQLFLTIGAQSRGYPATSPAAREVLQQHLAELYGDGFGSDPRKLLMIEGSGLARSQRSSAAGFMTVLEEFRPYAELLPEVNGVLRKSGTLSGVYNYAGYLRGSDGLYPFVIMTSQEANHRDEILDLLKRRL